MKFGYFHWSKVLEKAKATNRSQRHAVASIDDHKEILELGKRIDNGERSGFIADLLRCNSYVNDAPIIDEQMDEFEVMMLRMFSSAP